MSKKDDDRRDNSRLMEDVMEFCMSNSFEEAFESFAKEHTDVFMQALDFSENNTEHPLIFHEVYRKYLAKFEGLIEDFIRKVIFALHFSQVLQQWRQLYFLCLIN
jgi:hypothetical protein